MFVAIFNNQHSNWFVGWLSSFLSSSLSLSLPPHQPRSRGWLRDTLSEVTPAPLLFVVLKVHVVEVPVAPREELVVGDSQRGPARGLVRRVGLLLLLQLQKLAAPR